MANPEHLSADTVTYNRDHLRLWLCELTHLTQPQVEELMKKMEQQQQTPVSGPTH